MNITERARVEHFKAELETEFRNIFECLAEARTKNVKYLKRIVKLETEMKDLTERYVEALHELHAFAPAATSTSRWVEEELNKYKEAK